MSAITDNRSAQSLELWLTIKSNRTVSAKASDMSDIEPIPTRYEGLRKWTIDVLHDWLRRGRLRETRELQVLGGHLFDVLFDGPILDAFYRSYDEARKLKRRLVVRLNFGEGTEAMSELPWEYLYQLPSGNRSGFFLSAAVDLMLSRYLDVERRTKPEPDEGPLRVLLVGSEPPGEPVKHFELDAFTDAIRQVSKQPAPGQRAVQTASITPLADPTLMELLNAVGRVRPHVLHLVAPGRHRPEAGAEIALLSADGSGADWVSGERFATALAETGDWRVSVIFLQLSEAAESTETNGGVGLDRSFERLAPALVRTARIPAVIAMRSPVAINVAEAFTSWLYQQLANGETVDAAVRQGRVTVFLNPGPAPAWSFGTPVLYLQELDGLVQQPLVEKRGGGDRDMSSTAPVEHGGSAGGAEPSEPEESRFAKTGVSTAAEGAATGDAPRNEVEALTSRAARIIRAGRDRLDTLDVNNETRLAVKQWLMGLQKELTPLSPSQQSEFLRVMKSPDDETRQEVLVAVVDAAFDMPES